MTQVDPNAPATNTPAQATGEPSPQGPVDSGTGGGQVGQKSTGGQPNQGYGTDALAQELQQAQQAPTTDPNAALPQQDISGGAGVTNPGGTDLQNKLVQTAQSVLGIPYVYGGSDPKRGLDCSGLVQWAYAQVGISLPRVSYDQANAGIAVDRMSMQPGDLIFTTGDIGMRHDGHVAIYAGNGMMIEAPHTGANVQMRAVPQQVDAVRRIIGTGTGG